MVDILEKVRRKRTYYEQAPQWVLALWPSLDSFEWFCKSRRAELEKAGAMHKLGRDWFIDAEQFPIAVAKAYNLQAPAEQSTDLEDAAA